MRGGQWTACERITVVGPVAAVTVGLRFSWAIRSGGDSELGNLSCARGACRVDREASGSRTSY